YAVNHDFKLPNQATCLSWSTLDAIACFLDLRSVSTLARVCKSWRQLCNSDGIGQTGLGLRYCFPVAGFCDKAFANILLWRRVVPESLRCNKVFIRDESAVPAVQRMRHVSSLTLGCVPFDQPRHAGYQALFGGLRELTFLQGIEYERSTGRSFWISSAPLDLPALSHQAFPLLEQCVQSSKHRRILLQDLHTDRPVLLLLFDSESKLHDFEATAPSTITWLADRKLNE